MQFMNDVAIPLLDIFGCLAFCFIVSLLFAWMLGFSRKKELKKCDDVITAVLYDSKVEHVVDIVYIDKGIRDYSEPIYETTTGMKYHFFCIQDDGKHVFIERP